MIWLAVINLAIIATAWIISNNARSFDDAAIAIMIIVGGTTLVNGAVLIYLMAEVAMKR